MGGEFISAKQNYICNQKAPYMHEKNGPAERGWRTVVTMKDSLLIDSGLHLEFWAEAMDTANYLRNRLPTKSQRGELIPEEAWTEKKQDVSHIKVFGSTVSVLIPKEKRHKSDSHRNWKGIFVGYSDTTKHVRAWAPKTQQILLVSNPYINESEQGAKLLVDNPLDLTHRIAKRKVPTGEPGPRDQPRKIQATEAAETSLIKNTSLSPADTGDAETEIPSTYRRY